MSNIRTVANQLDSAATVWLIAVALATAAVAWQLRNIGGLAAIATLAVGWSTAWFGWAAASAGAEHIRATHSD